MTKLPPGDTPDITFRAYLERVASGRELDEDGAREAFGCIMQGQVSDVELAAFLVALKVRGESVDEIAGAVSAMRAIMVPVSAPAGAVDVVGTGGDAKGTFNISTAAAFVVAGAGVCVAKHGNRGSSAPGAADVLEELGVNIHAPRDGFGDCFREAGLAFLWAQHHHPAMRYAAPVRKTLKLRTIFNLLGPLLNPAGVKRLLIGVYAREWLKPMAEVMRRQGAEHVWVVYGADGMDELSTTGSSQVVQLKNDVITEFRVHPKDAGLPTATLPQLIGGDTAHNAGAIRGLLRGEPGPFRDVVLLNAAAALVIADKADTLQEGVQLAAAAIDNGAAQNGLDRLIAVTSAKR